VNEKMKIIHILSHSPGKGYEIDFRDPNVPIPPHFFKTKLPPYWVGFFENDWHVLLAKEIKNCTNEFIQECWRPYDVADQEYCKVIDGITHRLFPSSKSRSWGGECSPEMGRALRSETESGNVIVHLHGLHNRIFYRLIRAGRLKRGPVFATQRGGGYPRYHIKKNPLKIKMWLWEELYHRHIDHFFIQSKVEYNYLVTKYGHGRVSFIQDGIDFTEFKPLQKKIARETLGITDSKIVLLYIGRLYQGKGVENILWVYERLKEKVKDLLLILIGGSEENELYADAVESGAIVIPRIHKKELLKYYCAADITLYPTSNCIVRDFAGISNSNIESLACNTPIYTSQLLHFKGTESEIGLIGKQFINRSTMVEDILNMLNNLDHYSDCRNIAKKYYNRKKNISRIVMQYKKICDLYKTIEHEE